MTYCYAILFVLDNSPNMRTVAADNKIGMTFLFTSALVFQYKSNPEGRFFAAPGHV